MVGSCMWGQEVVDAMRDSIEGTLRDIMAQAPEGASNITVPQFSKGQPQPQQEPGPEPQPEPQPKQEPESEPQPQPEQEREPEASSA